jgi:hypothetical protein
MGTSAAVVGTGSRWNNITIADQGLHELLMMFAALLVVLISSHHLLLLPHTAAAATTTTTTTGGYMGQGCGTSGAVLAAAAATVAINTLNFSTSNLTCIDKMWPSGSPDNHFLLWVCMQCMFPPLLLLEFQLLLQISTLKSLCLCLCRHKSQKNLVLEISPHPKQISLHFNVTNLFQKICCEIAEEFGSVLLLLCFCFCFFVFPLFSFFFSSFPALMT